MRNLKITWYRGHKFTTWAELRRMWSRDYVRYVQIDHPDGTRTFPDMTDARIRRIAAGIAESIIADARNSGPEPVVFVTGNSYMPPLRSFDAAEDVWQHPANEDGEAFDYLAETLEEMLEHAGVALECPEYDNALYAVDLARFEFVEREDGEDDGDTLQDDWQPIPELPRGWDVHAFALDTACGPDCPYCAECGRERDHAVHAAD